jgi:hypothetical protein
VTGLRGRPTLAARRAVPVAQRDSPGPGVPGGLLPLEVPGESPGESGNTRPIG